MSETEKQEGQKTVVAFVAGLLIGGLLVWVFSAPTDSTAPTDTEDTPVGEEMDTENGTDTTTPGEDTTGDDDTNGENETAQMPTGDGAVTVNDQPAGDVVELASAEFPTTEGWVAVRDWDGSMVGGILGAARYSQSQGLIPQDITLLRATEPGMTYAVVFFTEDGAVTDSGNLFFDPAGDQQIEGIMGTFTAQ